MKVQRQTPLFEKKEVEQVVEPADLNRLWRLLEDLVGGMADRKEVLVTLGEEGAIRRNPLVAYVVIRLLDDPDTDVRNEAIRQLGIVVAEIPSDAVSLRVREIIGSALGKFDHRDLFGLLLSSSLDATMRGDMGRLLNLNPRSGELLADVVGDRSVPMSIRNEAVYFIGQLGFSQALGTLERLANRIESRQRGQGAMPFAAPANPEDAAMLPAIQEAIKKLQPF